MKKWMLIFLSLLLLAGCGAKEPEAQTPVEEIPAQMEPETETPEEPQEQQTVEIPTTINESEKSYTKMDLNVEYNTQIVEGLVEDTVGYALNCPEFTGIGGAETINQYYQEMMDYLIQYVQTNVYNEAADRHTVANVSGSFAIVAADEGLQLGVTYTVTVDFADSEELESFDRTDVFQPDTGTLLGAEG